MRQARRVSQRAARKAIRELALLKDADRRRHNGWTADYPGGVHTITCSLDDNQKGRLWGATAMGAVLVAKLDGNIIRVYAVKGD